MNEIKLLPVRVLDVHPHNPRRDLGDLTELADSIRTFGVMQNLTVVPQTDAVERFGEQHYTVIAGHRRCAAAKLAGLEELPCVIVELSPLEQQSVMMTENLQRENLTPVEQAWGFQMMINLGADVEEISRRTGVSKRRVKARLEVSKLDQKKLMKTMQERQISLADLDRLSRIDDVRVRNSLLDFIGTYNFEFRYRRALQAQEAEKAWPAVQKVLKELKAKKLKDSERWYGEYERFRELNVSDGPEAAKKAVKNKNKQLFYWYSIDDDVLWLYRKAERAAPQRRSEEEIETEKEQKQNKAEVQKLQEEFYEMRKAFALAQTVTKENRDVWISGAMAAIVLQVINYEWSDRDMILDAFGVNDPSSSGDKKTVEALSVLRTKKEKLWPGLIYGSFGDSKDQGYTYGYTGQWQRHKQNVKLDVLYELLENLGYHMCDDERAMFDGSHELLHRGEKAE